MYFFFLQILSKAKNMCRFHNDMCDFFYLYVSKFYTRNLNPNGKRQKSFFCRISDQIGALSRSFFLFPNDFQTLGKNEKIYIFSFIRFDFVFNDVIIQLKIIKPWTLRPEIFIYNTYIKLGKIFKILVNFELIIGIRHFRVFKFLFGFMWIQ